MASTDYGVAGTEYGAQRRERVEGVLGIRAQTEGEPLTRAFIPKDF